MPRSLPQSLRSMTCGGDNRMVSQNFTVDFTVESEPHREKCTANVCLLNEGLPDQVTLFITHLQLLKVQEAALPCRLGLGAAILEPDNLKRVTCARVKPDIFSLNRTV